MKPKMKPGFRDRTAKNAKKTPPQENPKSQRHAPVRCEAREAVALLRSRRLGHTTSYDAAVSGPLLSLRGVLIPVSREGAKHHPQIHTRRPSSSSRSSRLRASRSPLIVIARLAKRWRQPHPTTRQSRGPPCHCEESDDAAISSNPSLHLPIHRFHRFHRFRAILFNHQSVISNHQSVLILHSAFCTPVFCTPCSQVSSLCVAPPPRNAIQLSALSFAVPFARVYEVVNMLPSPFRS
jgi:hypothetical protein